MLTIYEIYASVQGESTHVGRPCVFVRLAACDLRCVWCDTPYAFTGGQQDVGRRGARRGRAVTGAGSSRSPAASRCCSRTSIALMERLVAEGYEVLLETGGHMPIDDVPDEVVTIVDVKCPASGEAAAMHWPNLDQLSPHDEVKFVIQDRADFDYAREVVERYTTSPTRRRPCCSRPCTACSRPTSSRGGSSTSALPARLQLQAHKYIWSPETRGV